MRGPDGAVRPHWQVLDRALNAFGPGEMWRRWEQARQLIRQHGVSFNVYGDARVITRATARFHQLVVRAVDRVVVGEQLRGRGGGGLDGQHRSNLGESTAINLHWCAPFTVFDPYRNLSLTCDDYRGAH